jgi:hypothetical protein
VRGALSIMLLAACGAKPARPPLVEPPCPYDGEAYLSILTPRLPPGCPSGVYLLDGKEMGRYPVRCARMPAGEHQLTIRSAGDCAGMNTCKVRFEVGRELRWDLRDGCPSLDDQNQSSSSP